MDFSYQSDVTPANAPVDPKEKDGRERDATGKFVPKNRQEAFDGAADAWLAKMKKDAAVDVDLMERMKPPTTEQAQDANAKADAPEQAADPKADDDVDKDAVAAALTTAKRLKIPAKVLESMSQKELAEAGKDWKKQSDESAKLSRELGEMRKQIEATKSAKVESAVADQPADVDELVKPSVASFDDETRNSLTGMSKVIVNKLRGEIVERDKRLDELNDRFTRLERHTEAESIRGEMSGAFPALGKSDVWGAVLKRADAIAKSEDYSDKIECPLPSADSQVSASTSGKRNGVATANVKAPRQAPTSKEDQMRSAYLRAVGQSRGA
jgi:hypothetical protein